ncbi:MAG: hypothetical protein KC620_12220 [Myxococcales bacterium]|nr:hypothetical protein [Myxococcales bacterium]
MRPIFLFAVGLALATACASRPEPEAPPIKTEMHAHYSSSLALREIVVQGDLSLLAAPADELSRQPMHPAFGEAARVDFDAMQQGARRAAGASTLSDAAAGVADVAAACGSCHQRLEVRSVPPSAPPEPAAEASVDGHMWRHHWGAAKLWDGLTRPSFADWKDGINALAEVPLQPEQLAARGATPEAIALGARVHALAADGVEAAPEARPAIYGAVIATCSGCHLRRVEAPPSPVIAPRVVK